MREFPGGRNVLAEFGISGGKLGRSSEDSVCIGMPFKDILREEGKKKERA